MIGCPWLSSRRKIQTGLRGLWSTNRGSVAAWHNGPFVFCAVLVSYKTLAHAPLAVLQVDTWLGFVYHATGFTTPGISHPAVSDRL